MHFSVPETSEQKDHKGSTYTCYSIHINGSPHCVLRYRQLHGLHDQLRREFHSSTLPTFPPKKLLPLTLPQIEERRSLLEKYLQLVSQDPRVANSVTFNGFLLAAQQETRSESLEDVNLDVFLMNDQKITVRGLTILQTDEVLERVCKQLGVSDEFVYYFALFLIQRKENGEMTVVRKLQDFESPYVSQKSMSGLKLVLRKCYWDPDIDLELFHNKASLNLLYVQTLSDVERGWVIASAETKKTLARMQSRGAKREFMEVARSLKFYGYIHFLPCLCDYPMSNTPVQVTIGVRELVIRVQGPDGEDKEGSFKVTKMRCWRIMTLTNPKEAGSSDGTKLELSFEYLMNNQQLQWVTIVSSQAILMSICLQSMVEELLRKKSNILIKKAGEKSCTTEYVFQKKDGTHQILPIRSGLHSRIPHDKVNNNKNVNLSSLTGRQYSVKKLSEKFDVVNMKEASRAAEDVFIENEAFSDIRDDDL